MIVRLALGLLLSLVALPAGARSFAEIAAAARGQTVYFNAWGGSRQINDYIAWTASMLRDRYGVTLTHVKLTDTTEAVARVAAEKAAGRNEGGTVDLIWINGENFAAMKREGLLFGPFTQLLPSFALVDTTGQPTTLVDFTIPTDGFESPWGMAKFVLFYDTARLATPPTSVDALLAWAEANPGRFTHPAPPDFIGTTFLKHVLYAVVADPDLLKAPVTADTFDRMTVHLWQRLDRVRPHLWRNGRSWPTSAQAQHQLLDDGEVDFSMAFNPAEASSLILAGRLPPTVRSFVFADGTVANTHFLAIPFNAAHKEGALVTAEFLLSPETQARKQDERVWGDPTVLDLAALAPVDRARFDGLAPGPATLTGTALGPALPEPHPSWTELLERRWAERYGG